LNTACSCTDASSVTKLPDLSSYQSCDDDSVQWMFHEVPSQLRDSPYILFVIYENPSGEKVDGSQQWSSTDFPVAEDGTQSFGGEPDFVISCWQRSESRLATAV
jgi:hypothetical protein